VKSPFPTQVINERSGNKRGTEISSIVRGYLHIRNDDGDEIVERNTVATFMDKVQITAKCE